MTLEEAIEHCEDVAKSCVLESERWEITSKTYDGYTLSALEKAEECRQCAEEHRQLAEWLKELKMWRELKEVIAYAIKKKCSEYSLVEWCKTWGFSIEDFERFLKAGNKEFEED